MRAILAKLAVRKVLGLYITDQELILSRVALTPLGPVEVDRRRESFVPEQLPQAMERILKPVIGRRKPFQVPIAIGLPARRIFFSTRPMQTIEHDAAPEVLLHEVLQSPNINVDDMAVDLIRVQPGKRSVVSIVSCRRKFLSGLLAALEECGVRPYRAEPAPCALLRVAALRHRAPRKAKTVVRVFLGRSEALAMQVAGDLPLIWRSCDLPATAEGALAAITSTVLSLQILGQYCGIETAADLVMIHGRPDLADVLGSAALREKVNARVIHHPGPELEGEAIALGLALGCQPTVHAFDLARTLKPRASLWELFPWGEVAVQAAILTCATLFLNYHARSLETKYRAVRAETARHPWLAKVTDANLEKEKKERTQKVEAIHQFLNSRILWTKYTQDAAQRLPANIVLKSFDGQCEMESTGVKSVVAKSKKSFVLKLAVPISDGNAMPKEIDDFLDSLRADALLQRDFPLVEMADLKQSQRINGAKPIADFSVICLPRPDKGPAKSAPGGAANKKKAAP
ncbi:MAG: hypothetical protein ACHRXM_40220 [Isosphaerales bacterium]